jgi:hypothetical protein
MVSRFVSMALAFALAATVSFAAGESDRGRQEVRHRPHQRQGVHGTAPARQPPPRRGT